MIKRESYIMPWRKVFGLHELPESENLLDLQDKNFISIIIESVKEGGEPISTIGYYKVAENYKKVERAKKVYFTDADSGEQGGLATTIPEEINKVLVQFGLPEKPLEQ